MTKTEKLETFENNVFDEEVKTDVDVELDHPIARTSRRSYPLTQISTLTESGSAK